MAVYYNEIDPFAAAWLRNLIAAGHIPDGDVDERSIADVQPMDLKNYLQCHFFAGIGGWSHALRLANWPDDRPIWTGSCPCQPFSVAGKGKGKEDERHLWPVFHQLIAKCRPTVVMGEQVAGKAGYDWFDGVAADLEGEEYSCRAIDIPACAVNAPHIRQRLYWVATNLANADMREPEQYARHGWRPRQEIGAGSHVELAGRGELVSGDMADADNAERRQEIPGGHDARRQNARRQEGPGDNGGRCFWHDAEWLTGADGKTRRAKPGVRLLVDGLSANLERLRAIEQEAWEEIVNYANSCGSDTDEAMRVLREAIPAQARREEQPVGMRFQLHETALLLDFLFCVDAARDRAANSRCVSEEVDEARGRIVRSMWAHGEAGRPSCERRPYEQLSGEPANPMLALSFVLARLAAAYREAARDANASAGRVGRLRGYGNAIVPPLAAEVIKAFMNV